MSKANIGKAESDWSKLAAQQAASGHKFVCVIFFDMVPIYVYRAWCYGLLMLIRTVMINEDMFEYLF